MKRLRVSAVKRILPRWLCTTTLKSSANNTILLTFDDGPHPDATPAILERLSEFGARAIFFVVGERIPRAPWTLRRIVDAGHWLGNHTFSHPIERRMGYREYCDELVKCQEAVFSQAGIYPRFHRAPSGQMTIASLIAPKSQHLSTIHWSCSTEDWRVNSLDEAVLQADQVLHCVRARDILLFHNETMHTVAMLDRMLPVLQARNLKLAPSLDQLG